VAIEESIRLQINTRSIEKLIYEEQGGPFRRCEQPR
jgi:hypothetical protein